MEKKLNVISWCSIFMILATNILLPQNGNVKFEHLGLEEGLSPVNVRQIVQDKEGFIWVATPDGLNKSDGYQFTRYRHDPADSTSLAANSTNAIYVDRDGVLWVGSFDALHRYDRLNDHFIRYQHIPGDSTSLPVNYVQAIVQDKQSTLWVGTNAGLAALTMENRETGKFNIYQRRLRRNYKTISGNVISALAVDNRPGSNAIWIGTRRSGLSKLDLTSRRFTFFFPQHPAFPEWYQQYHDSLMIKVDSLIENSSQHWSITGLPDTTRKTRIFDVEKTSHFLVAVMGEGNQKEVFDYGGIVNAKTQKVVWQMASGKTRAAGGNSLNRLQIETLRLPPGHYELFYQTDLGHTSDNWNKRPPKRQPYWGIQLIPIETAEVKKWQSALARTTRQDYIYNGDITCIFPDPEPDVDGNAILWVGTTGGLNRVVLPPEASTPEKFIEDHLQYYEPENIKVSFFQPVEDDPFSLKSHCIYTIYKSQFGGERNLWIGAPEGGLAQLRFENGRAKFTYFNNDPSNPHSLSSNTVSSIFEDHSGNLWVGTEDGMNKMSRRKLAFRHYTSSIDPSRKAVSLPKKYVMAIYEDREGISWISTAGNGLSRFDPGTGIFDHYLPSNAPGSAPWGNISAICEIPGVENTLWLATYGSGLFKFDKLKRRFDQISQDWHWSEGFQTQGIHSLYPDSKGMLWLATSGNGLIKVNPHSGETVQYRRILHPDSSIERMPASNEIWCIAEMPNEKGQELWLGYIGGGLSRFDVTSARFTHFPESLKGATSINSKSVTALHVSRDSVLWIGTYSGGINRFHRDTETFSHYTTRQNLPNNMVQGILEDDWGKLWISTNSGLSQFHPATETFKNYDVNDGLQSNQFNRGAYYRSASGKMYFGGINGFSCFHPDSLKENTVEPLLVLTDFKIFDKSKMQTEKGKYLLEEQKVQLAYHENFFSFEFVALDYTNPLKNEYAYQLIGFDNDWVYCGQRRYASYTNLDPGDYEFRIIAANSDGVWNHEGITINITITPPFWKTWWFYLLTFSALVLSIFLIHTYRVNQKIERMRHVERVRKKAAADFHDELGHKLTKISLFSELIRRNINGASPETSDYLNRISDISGNLYNGMRDFLWTLDPAKDSLYEVAIRLKDFGDEFFDKTGVAFHVKGISKAALNHIVLSMDWKRHLILIFKEAMNNVLKYAEAENVLLEISVKDDHVKISLQDDGIGIAKKNDVPKTLEALSVNGNGSNGKKTNGHFGNSKHQNGIGHGLNNMKDRAKKLNGCLDILSPDTTHGTVIEFRGKLPEKSK